MNEIRGRETCILNIKLNFHLIMIKIFKEIKKKILKGQASHPLI